MIFNADTKHPIGERIYIKCAVCCMVTEQIVIESAYTDTQAAQCTECQATDEWII